MKILMCRPDYFAIKYEINPWMNISIQVDHRRAHAQWQKLYKTYQELDVEIELIDQVEDQPDMVFTANAGIVRGKRFVSGNFRHQERKGEEQHFQRWFADNGYRVVSLKHFQGGEGDALFYKDTLYMGYGFRSEPSAHKEVADILGLPFISLHLIDPYYYDFDTTFCPLGDRGFLYYPFCI